MFACRESRRAASRSSPPPSPTSRATASRRGVVFDGCVRIRYGWTIPREVGLGSLSAIVVATLRALAAHAGATIADADLPRLALALETEELGIAAGLQDRVAQTYEGVT